jgi:beta-lactam-binding protein with PASTA domain
MVQGKSLGQARRLLSARQCMVGAVRHMRSAPNRKGKIVRERPAQGTTLDANFKVDLWLGKGR